ncbi:MAG: UPF0146 family protein [Halobacteriales archaeon]
MERSTGRSLADRFRPFDPVVELAIGRQPAVARRLAETNAVTATDRVDRPVPAGVEFLRDDLTAPSLGRYAHAEALYALNLPPELHRPALELAEAIEAPLAFTTLGHEAPIVPIETRERLPRGTLFWARADDPS